MKILAATDFSTRSRRAVRRAGFLAREKNAELMLLHVVDDDQPQKLVQSESREAQIYLAELSEGTRDLRDLHCETMVVASDPFEGILHAARTWGADLIVMGAHRRQKLRDILIGTTIERVIRTGPFPVLMVNGEVVSQYRRVMAAVSPSEPSAHAIRTAHALGLAGPSVLMLVHAFDPLAEGKMALAGVERPALDDYVAAEAARARQSLTAFLDANGLAWEPRLLHLEKGLAAPVIRDAVKALSADLLVMGTHGRSGISKFFLGSVTEEMLRSAAIDVLAVAPR